MSLAVEQLLARYRASGREFTAAGVRSFALDAGAADAEPVVCVHGVPASAYLYRKVVAAVARRGLRGIAVDLPGLGFAERPADFDYTWSGLGRRHRRPDLVARQAFPARGLPRRDRRRRLPSR
ncbi:alpha/beta fold hydrolase [Mycolicibacterium cosmeticum]|uniref:alpha/beta fold hydrolase n=1 Tax=Mycolicibacterium cosmeticum TaxID=258533 RepID=UPI0032047316